LGGTIDYLRETPDLPERFWEIYAVDSTGRLQSTVALDRLLRTKRPVPIAELIDEELHPVRVTDDQEDVARLFEHYDLVATPVVGEADRLVGVIPFADIVAVIEQEAEEDIRALGGVGREEGLSDPVLFVARGRFNWLLVNLATAFLASPVLGLFEGSCRKWWRWRCWRRSWRARAVTLRPRP
jgi:magnesium transporter